jgi:glycosyltransferase involved in cell wall biosynthesis
MPPKVSILIPNYNHAHFLDEAIQSALNQTYTDFELIIVDNCSTDNTDEIVAKYLSDKRVSYVKNEHNLGLVGNWNKCLELANGEYIKFLCSDDKFHPQLLEKFVPIMEQYPNVSLVTSNKIYFGSIDETVFLPFNHLVPGKEMIYQTLLITDFIGDPTCVMIRKSNLKLGGFRTDMLWIVDWEMWIRHLLVGDCYVVPDVLLYTRKHPEQNTNAVVKKNFLHRFSEYEFFKMLRDNNRYDLDVSAVNINKLVKKKATECTKHVVYKQLHQLHKPKTRQAFKKALRIAVHEQVLFSSLGEIMAGYKNKFTNRLLGKAKPKQKPKQKVSRITAVSY